VIYLTFSATPPICAAISPALPPCCRLPTPRAAPRGAARFHATPLRAAMRGDAGCRRAYATLRAASR